MTRLEKIRLTKQEQKTAQLLGTIPVLTIVVLIKLLLKLKRWLLILFLAGFVTWGYSTISAHAVSPKADLAHPYSPTPTPTSQFLEIKAYIRQVFGDQTDNAFKVLACENRGLNPNAQGHNANGTVDTGIFQVNSIWANPEVLKDWKTNVDMAHVIYLRGGWGEWSCESVWHALERSDTI